jgi:hypothetical protein
MSTLRLLLPLAIALAALAGAGARAQTASEPITEAADGKRKINLSGRQRMLSQYMAKAVCFASLGIDERTQVNEMMLTRHLFDQTLADLRNGSEIQRMLPETDAQILAALDKVGGHWAGYGAAVAKRELAAVAGTNLTVLATSNEAVTLFERKYGSLGKVSKPIAAALNISGRQRMLTQKASKELCFIAAGRDAETNRGRLKETIALFERSMRGLRDGDGELGLEAAPAGEIIDQIDRANEAWAALRPIFAKVADGAAPSTEDLAFVSQRNVAVMQAMNAMVELYELLTE